jgi:hypothetical protein
MDWRKSVRTDWGKLWSLPAAQRRILGRACGLLLLTAVALRLLGLRRWQATLARWCRLPVHAAGRKPGGYTALPRLVHAAARRLLGDGSCLPESLVLWALLRQYGIESQLRFGVRRHAGRLEAHAWVERDGRALNDGDTAAYAPFEQTIAPSGFRAA